MSSTIVLIIYSVRYVVSKILACEIYYKHHIVIHAILLCMRIKYALK